MFLFFAIQSTFKIVEKQHIEDIQTIKEMMSKSTQFMSLSGISGILAGIYALTATYLAYSSIYIDQSYLAYRKAMITSDSLMSLLLLASITLILSVGSGAFFSIRKIKRNNEIFWNEQTNTNLNIKYRI